MFVREGKVKVNGRVVREPAYQVDPKDKVEIIGETSPKTTIAFYKPRGISSSKVASEGKNIFDLLPQYKNLNAIGRLDKESEGLILLSDDGVLTNIITGKDHKIEKEYIVDVREKVIPSKIKALSDVMILEDGPTLKSKTEALGKNTFSIILKEGRNHQVRRMSNKVRLTVTKLKRVRIGPVLLGELKSGKYRKLEENELNKLKK